MRFIAALLTLVLSLAACGGDKADEPAAGDASATSTSAAITQPQSDTSTAAPTTSSVPLSERLFPDVLEVVVTESDTGSFSFDVTMSSPYDTEDRYADAWRVVGTDGTVYGVRELLHGHGTEQPFTRSLAGVDIPSDVLVVTVEGRDQLNGWGGATVEVAVPHG